jgi:serine protease Do
MKDCFRFICRAACSWFLVGLLVSPGRGEGVPQEQIYKARDKVFPALVHVQPISEVFERGKKTKQTAVGSGVIISDEGYVITNYHVAGKAVKAICTLASKDRIPATLVGGDPLTDLAVIKLDLSEYDGDLYRARLGDSSNIEAGQFVLAMGSPLSLSRSISEGIISCPDRYLGDELTLADGEKTGGYHTWIQTTAAINFGNSGGPLVNLEGEIIGINTRTIVGADGLGFSIPSNVVREITDQIIKNGSVKRSWIGVDLQPHQELDALFRDEVAKGVLVSQVEPRSPADAAGVMAGDWICKIDGEEVDARFEEEVPDVLRRISDVPVGTTLELEISRVNGGSSEQGESRSVRIVTREMGKTRGEEKEFGDWGFSAQSLTLTKLLELNRPRKNGVLVSGVTGVTTQEPTDLIEDDIIMEVDGVPVENLEELAELHGEYGKKKPDKIVLKTERVNVVHFVVLYPKYDEEASSVGEQN